MNQRHAEHFAALIAGHCERTAKSRRAAIEGSAIRVDTRAPKHFVPEVAETAYPLVGSRAEGARIWDVDGNQYVDIAMGMGSLLCGHNAPFIRAAVDSRLDRNIQLGPIADEADLVAQSIAKLTGLDRVCFAVTGTAAVAIALRLAYAATRKDVIVLFEGSYHGQADHTQCLSDPARPSFPLPLGLGIKQGIVKDARLLRYGEGQSLDYVKEHIDELAAVLVEPVQSRNPGLQPRQFLVELRELTARHGVPLIFDEVITGFRVHPRGAQGWFDVEPDLATYGKCLAGGLAMSVIAGKSRFLDLIDGGPWPVRNHAALQGTTAVARSTYEMHPMAMAAAHALLAHLLREGGALQQSLNERTTQLVRRINEGLKGFGAPIRAVHFGSIFRFAPTDPSAADARLLMEAFYLHLLAKGVYVWDGRTCFLSTAHTDQDLDSVVAASLAGAERMAEAAFFD